MRCICCAVALLFAAVLGAQELPPGQGKELRLGTAKQEIFQVQSTAEYRVNVERYLVLRFAQLKIAPRTSDDFDLMLRFVGDPPDMARFDTPEKMRRAVSYAARDLVALSQEKKTQLQEMKISGRFVCYATFTDAGLSSSPEADGQFRHITVGVLRLSDDTAMQFKLRSKERSQWDVALEYMRQFIRPTPVACTQP